MRVSNFHPQEKAVQTALHRDIMAAAALDVDPSIRSALRPLWHVITSTYVALSHSDTLGRYSHQAPNALCIYSQHVVQRLYSDAQGMRACGVCGSRFGPQDMQAHMMR